MTKPLGDFHFDESAYDRSNDDWVCGHSSEGRPCPIGPSGTGHCQAEQICIPYLKQERWCCNRPSAWGGKCKDGPLPGGDCSHPFPGCHPARSLMARRRALTFAVATVTIGVLLIALGGDRAGRIVSPGEVAAAHGNVEENCAGCHVAAEGSIGDWILLAGEGGGGLADSERCSICHPQGEHSLAPHSFSPEELAGITQRVTGASDSDPALLTSLVADIMPDVPQSADGELACSTCHHEHHGREFDLTHLGDRACQSCHAGRFDSFSQGHPEFGSYPHERRTRLHFDHSTHYGRHFAVFERLMRKGIAPDSCATCHILDEGGREMLVRGFDASCATCHASQIEDHGLPGVEFIRFAAVDLETLHAHELDVGEWPLVEQHGGGPPFLELLLSADPEYLAAQETLGGIPLDDLAEADAEQLQAAATIVWSTKRLIHELVERREPALEERFAQTLTGTVNPSSLAALTGRPVHGPPFFDALAFVQETWLPSLAVELAAREGAGANDFPDGAAAVDSAASRASIERDVSFGNWYVAAHDRSLRFRPAGHADSLLSHWIEVSAVVAGREFQPTAAMNELTTQPPPGETDSSQEARAELALSGMLQQMTDAETAGRCMKCHTLDRSVDDELIVNWYAARPVEALQEFTRFSHAPHLTRGGDSEGCRSCHNVNAEIDLLPGEFVTLDLSPSTDQFSSLTSGLAPITRQRCVECHTPNRAGEGCLTCHNYHVGQFLPVSDPFR